MEPQARDIIDDRLLHGLHVEAVRRAGVHPEHEPHLVFQAATLDALFGGHFDGDLTFAEVAEHGDLGIGTLNGLDGEMLALDGRSCAPTRMGTWARSTRRRGRRSPS